MDVAKALVRCVARAFYDVKHVLVIDALMIHNALRDDDMGHLLGLQTKDLHKLCGKLKEDRMLHVHTRLEAKENQQRPVNRTYYYVDFRATIDAVKYRMHKVVKDVERKMNKDADTKGYVCPRCNKQFLALDVVTLETTPTGFACDRCGTDLVDDDDSAEVKSSQERLGRLMDQLKPVIDLLKKIDEVVVPQNEFEDAFRNAVPVSRQKSLLSAAATGPTTSDDGVPYAKGGVNNTAAAPLEVTFTSSEDKSAQEKAAEQARRTAQMEQNALPVWHLKSTVSGEITKLGLREAAAQKEREGYLGKAEDDTSRAKSGVSTEEGGVQLDAIQQYYAALAAKKQQELREEAEEEEEEEDEEEDEFEDVVATNPAANGSGSAIPSGKQTPKLDEESDSGSSSSAAGGGRGGKPAMSQPGDGPPMKKVKVQTPHTTTPMTIPARTGGVKEEEEEEEEDEDEFEDAI